ncbi:hypothetical protein V6N12_051393 [Hibiscus sabdariffa]|uniref:Uncharacterized protein n=1 Tax=Hibiscus sabdariffa TaxID=183260 RepID=A0ABR2GFA8_9ROSI
MEARFSTFSLCDMVEKLDVVVPFVVYWRVSHTELCTSSVRPLKTDNDCIAMLNSLPSNREEDHVAEEEENYEAEEEEDAEYHVVEEEENNVAAKEETNVAAEEENSADVEEETNDVEEEDVSVAEEEDESAADEENESAADEFDISDNEYDCGKDEAYRQEDDIGIRV